MKKIVYFIIFLALSLGLMIGLMEGLGRILIWTKFGIQGKSYGLWGYDSELGADHRPNAYNTLTRTNNYGFRNQENVFEPKPENSIRAIAFGGSTTFGYNLSDNETYTKQLQDRLRRIKGLEESQVLNAGRICWSASHNLILMKRLVPKLKPDYAILYEGLNEITNAYALNLDGISLDDLKGTYGKIGMSLDQNRWLKQNSVIVRFFDYYVKKILLEMRGNQVLEPKEISPAQEPSEIHPWIVENYRHVLKEMIHFLKENDVKPIMVRFAFVNSPHTREIFTNISYEVAQEEEVPVCDMRRRFEQYGDHQKDLFIGTGVHVTPQGAKILADELLKTILGEMNPPASKSPHVQGD